MKKIILSIFVFLFLVPVTLAEDSQITSYQKIKNITKHDHPAGSGLTMGFAEDEIRFLIFVQNKTAEKVDLTILDILPEHLIYQPNSTYRYRLNSGLGWQKIQDINSKTSFPLQEYTLKTEANTGYYLKFSTHVSNKIPANNVTLSNFVNIQNNSGEIFKKTVTKVLIPNSKIVAVQDKTTSKTEKEYINKILEEEQEFIEKTFFDLAERGFEADLPEKEILNSKIQTETTQGVNSPVTCSLKQFIIYLVSVIILILFLFFLKSKFGGDQDYDNYNF